MVLDKLFEYPQQYYKNLLDQRWPGLQQIISSKRPVIIYGAGRMGRMFKDNLNRAGIKVLAFSDMNHNHWQEGIDGTPVMPPENLESDYPDAPIFIASLLYESEIYKKLVSMNLSGIYPLCYLNLMYPEIFRCEVYDGIFNSVFKKENHRKIYEVNQLLQDDLSRDIFAKLIEFRLTFNTSIFKEIKSESVQYFEKGIIKLTDQEVLIDCGAYTGDTVEAFINLTGGNFKKIYAFEPDKFNFVKLHDLVNQIGCKNVLCCNSGIYKATQQLRFSMTGGLDSGITDDIEASLLEVVSLDEYMQGKDEPTFIKMDIEGAEEPAIEGCKEIIATSKPTLAIAAYHKPEDLWEIPLQIRRYNPGYKFYFRHYTPVYVDTVCYAV